MFERRSTTRRRELCSGSGVASFWRGELGDRVLPSAINPGPTSHRPKVNVAFKWSSSTCKESNIFIFYYQEISENQLVTLAGMFDDTSILL